MNEIEVETHRFTRVWLKIAFKGSNRGRAAGSIRKA